MTPTPETPSEAAEAPAAMVPAEAPRPAAFPVMGVGASAGGLDALKALFSAMPPDTGVAFVVVTHLHPEHVSLLPELLAKATDLPVSEATDGTAIEPNHIYVALPGANLTVDGGVLHRTESDEQLHLPIDHFLRSLAADTAGQTGQAMCTILSGTGTDGTLGLQAIKAAAGMAMAQTPSSAQFSSMPLSAERTGLVDYSLEPSDMPAALAGYVDGLTARSTSAGHAGPSFSAEALRAVLKILRLRTGSDFSSYKPSTIRRRIERRMNVHRISSLAEYARFLEDNGQEPGLLFRELLITVTRFFRDPEAFEALADLLSSRLAVREDAPDFRAWVAGCASGEEAYSIAILVSEVMARLDRAPQVTIFATDLDPSSITRARKASFPSGIAADVSKERLARYFVLENDRYRVRPAIRDLIVFAPHNLLSDPPFTRLDLIICRNLLIYFDTPQQQRTLPMFGYALRDGGMLFLGPSETVGPMQELFEPLDRKWKIFQRKPNQSLLRASMAYEVSGQTRRPPLPRVTSAVSPVPLDPAPTPNMQSEVQINRLLLHRFAPPCLVVDPQGEIVHVQGRMGPFLEPASGRPTLNVLDMARSGLAAPLSAALERASREKGPVTRERVWIGEDGSEREVDLVVEKIRQPSTLRGLLLVVFRPSDPGQPPRRRDHEGTPSSERITELEDELRYARESLQSTVEELESSNEELRSANEELQSTNEELHSSNEELETSKEELQSLNEELNTVNTELGAKVEELSHANDDMQNLLNSIAVATVFLDQQLRVKRYTEQARELIHLLPTDVGRPLEDLALHIDHPTLLDDCQQVLDTLERRELEIQDRNGRWLMMRILPYRTSRNVIDGVVATFVPIDRLKRAEAGAQDAQLYFDSIVQTVREPLLVLDHDLVVQTANEAFYSTFREAPKQVQGRRIYALGDGAWDIPQLRSLLEEVLPTDLAFRDFEVEHVFPGVGRRRFLLNARRIRRKGVASDLILLALEQREPAREKGAQP